MRGTVRFRRLDGKGRAVSRSTVRTTWTAPGWSRTSPCTSRTSCPPRTDGPCPPVPTTPTSPVCLPAPWVFPPPWTPAQSSCHSRQSHVYARSSTAPHRHVPLPPPSRPGDRGRVPSAQGCRGVSTGTSSGNSAGRTTRTTRSSRRTVWSPAATTSCCATPGRRIPFHAPGDRRARTGRWEVVPTVPQVREDSPAKRGSRQPATLRLTSLSRRGSLLLTAAPPLGSIPSPPDVGRRKSWETSVTGTPCT